MEVRPGIRGNGVAGPPRYSIRISLCDAAFKLESGWICDRFVGRGCFVARLVVLLLKKTNNDRKMRRCVRVGGVGWEVLTLAVSAAL